MLLNLLQLMQRFWWMEYVWWIRILDFASLLIVMSLQH